MGIIYDNNVNELYNYPEKGDVYKFDNGQDCLTELAMDLICLVRHPTDSQDVVDRLKKSTTCYEEFVDDVVLELKEDPSTLQYVFDVFKERTDLEKHKYLFDKAVEEAYSNNS